MNVREIVSWHPNGLRVQAALEAAGSSARIVETIEPSPTAVRAAAQLDIEIGQVANSLLFDADGEPLLILASGAHRVDTQRVARDLGVAALHRPGPDFVREHTGQPIGGVAPLGHPEPVRTVIDTALAAWPVVWAAGGHPRYVFPTSFEELVRMTGGTALAVGAMEGV